jgi:hypothetical protein
MEKILISTVLVRLMAVEEKVPLLVLVAMAVQEQVMFFILVEEAAMVRFSRLVVEVVEVVRQELQQMGQMVEMVAAAVRVALEGQVRLLVVLVVMAGQARVQEFRAIIMAVVEVVVLGMVLLAARVTLVLMA